MTSFRFPSLVLALVSTGACGDNLVADFKGDARGPLPVGVTTITVADSDRCNTFTNECPRRFAVEIWYPATEASRFLPFDVIDFSADMPQDMQEKLGDFQIPASEQKAVRDASPRTGLRYPLVLFSHGDAAIRYQSHTYATFLASHGYVVIAPDHAGNTIFEVPELEDLDRERAENAFMRPRDFSFLLDRLERDELTGGRIEQIIDLDRVAASGHSFGGFTSLLITNPLTSLYDNRVDLAIPISPATSALDYVGAPINLNVTPTFYIAGSDDLVTPLHSEVKVGFDSQTTERGIVVLDRVGHLGFTDFCAPEIAEATRILDYPSYFSDPIWDGCGIGFLDPTITQEEAAYFALAWLEQYFDGIDRRWEMRNPPFDGTTVELKLE